MGIFESNQFTDNFQKFMEISQAVNAFSDFPTLAGFFVQPLRVL